MTAQSHLGRAPGRNWRIHDLDFQRKFKFRVEKYGIPKKVDHDEKSGIVLEEKGDVPAVHR